VDPLVQRSQLAPDFDCRRANLSTVSSDRRVAETELVIRAAQGVAFLLNYVILLFYSIGITDVYFIVVMIYMVLVICSMVNLYTLDRLGRRTSG